MSLLGDKLRLLIDGRHMTQAQLADLSGLSQGIISQLVNGKQNSVSAENLKRLSVALHMPVTYFVTDSVKEYVATRLATRSPMELEQWGQASLAQRLRWTIQDLDTNWGPQYGTDALARASNISIPSLKSMLDGRLSVSPNVLRAVSDITGVPTSVYTGDPGELPASEVPSKYAEIAEAAFTLGLDPDYVLEMLVLLARRPEPLPPRPTDNAREPGE